MTIEELKNEWELSSYNEDTSEQLDYYMNTSKNNIGDVAYLYLHEDFELRELEIVNIIVRSDNPKYYDELLENDDVLINGEDNYDADTSAEFITDYDCYLVWFRVSKKHNWIIASCNTDVDGINVYRFRGTIHETKEKILSMIKEDVENDSESYEHGTESVTDIQSVDAGLGYELYGHSSYSNYHIDYTAKEVNCIRSI